MAERRKSPKKVAEKAKINCGKPEEGTLDRNRKNTFSSHGKLENLKLFLKVEETGKLFLYFAVNQ